MIEDDLNRLKDFTAPQPSEAAKARAFAAAMDAFDAEKIHATAPQGSAAEPRLTDRIRNRWGEMMQKKMAEMTAGLPLPPGMKLPF